MFDGTMIGETVLLVILLDVVGLTSLEDACSHVLIVWTVETYHV